MTNNSFAKMWQTRLLVSVSCLTLVLVFFLAPIVPVDIAFSCPTILGPPNAHYTDWQSPSFYLFKIGYHYTSPHPSC